MSGTPSSPPPDVTTSVRPEHPNLSRKGNMTRDTNVPNTWGSENQGNIWNPASSCWTGHFLETQVLEGVLQVSDVGETGLRLPSFLTSSVKAPGSTDRRPLSEGFCVPLSRETPWRGRLVYLSSSHVSPRLLNRVTANRTETLQRREIHWKWSAVESE